MRPAALARIGILVSVTTSPVWGQNILINPGFNADLGGWTADPTGSVVWSSSDEDGSSSSGAALLTNTSAEANSAVELSQCVALPPGSPVFFRGLYRIPSGQSRKETFLAEIDYYAAGDCSGTPLTGVQNFADSLPPGYFDRWLEIGVGENDSVALAASSARASVRLTKVEAGGSVQAYFDASSLAALARVTIPVVASLAGRNNSYFRTEMSLFNSSRKFSGLVWLHHRCPIGQTCASQLPLHPPETLLGVAPRTSATIPDILSTIGEPGTSGALEVSYDSSMNVAIQTRLYSTLPASTVGAGIPALPASEARIRSVLLGLTSCADSAGERRSNAGVYNPSDSSVSVTFTLFQNGTDEILGVPLTRVLSPNEPYQVNDILGQLGAASSPAVDAFLVVTSTSPVFSYATLIENLSANVVYIGGAADSP